MILRLTEDERAVVFRLGRFHRVGGPGLVWTLPIVDSAVRVNLTTEIPGWRSLPEPELNQRVRGLVVEVGPWCQFASEIGAEFIEGGVLGTGKVLAKVNQWTITLDSYTSGGSTEYGAGSTTFTRMTTPYLNRDGFRFAVYGKSVFSGLGKLLGMQDVEVGYPDFDHEFIIKANDEFKVRELLANPRIRELIESQPSITLQVKHDTGWFRTSLPEGVDQLYLEEAEVISDVQRLKSLHDLFVETLNQLCRIGSACEEAPNVTL